MRFLVTILAFMSIVSTGALAQQAGNHFILELNGGVSSDVGIAAPLSRALQGQPHSESGKIPGRRLHTIL